MWCTTVRPLCACMRCDDQKPRSKRCTVNAGSALVNITAQLVHRSQEAQARCASTYMCTCCTALHAPCKHCCHTSLAKTFDCTNGARLEKSECSGCLKAPACRKQAADRTQCKHAEGLAPVSMCVHAARCGWCLSNLQQRSRFCQLGGVRLHCGLYGSVRVSATRGSATRSTIYRGQLARRPQNTASARRYLRSCLAGSECRRHACRLW